MTAWMTPGWIVQSLVASAILMILVLAFRGLVTRFFGARLAYALWLLPALRLVLPPIAGWKPLAIPGLFVTRDEGTVGLVDPDTAARMVGSAPDVLPEMAVHLDLASAPVAPPPMPIDWSLVLLAVWLAGAALVFAVQMLRYRRFLRRALTDAEPLARECGIDVLLSPHVSGPVSAGILHRRILLPTDFLARYSSSERRLALKHEAAHHDRRDIVANLAALCVVSLHWFNPFAYVAYRAFRADQELACDATVLADAGQGDRYTYGSAMLKSASGRMPAMACALSHKDQLRKRISMMAQAPHKTWQIVCGSALTLAAIGGGLLLTASGQAQEPTDMALAADEPGSVEPMRRHVTVVHRPATAEERRTVRHAQRAAAKARAHAEIARRDALAAAAEARVEVGRASIEADRARIEALRAEAEVRRVEAEARREDARAIQEASRAAARASRDANRAHRDLTVVPDVSAIVRVSLASAKSELAAQCARQGYPQPAGADFGTLATCGEKLHDTIRTALRDARTEIEHNRALSAEDRAHALAGIDRAMDRNTRNLRHD